VIPAKAGATRVVVQSSLSSAGLGVWSNGGVPRFALNCGGRQTDSSFVIRGALWSTTISDCTTKPSTPESKSTCHHVSLTPFKTASTGPPMIVPWLPAAAVPTIVPAGVERTLTCAGF
jgi:hypothetical protein